MTTPDSAVPELRYLGLFVGTVIDVEDPEALHRVRVKIPGLLDDPGTTWAWPMGTMGGGSAGRGGWVVPAKGSDVCVFFLQGDPARPYYTGGWWGKPKGQSEMPEGARDLSPADAPKVQAFEGERLSVTLDEREASAGLVIKDKLSGDTIEFDFVKMGLRIKATSALIIEADGFVEISGAEVHINGRIVSDANKAI
jgi:hypothetical protein